MEGKVGDDTEPFDGYGLLLLAALAFAPWDPWSLPLLRTGPPH
jgi:hypothetical protein